MHYYHWGYEINEKAIENKASTSQKYIDDDPLDASINYVCPIYGHLINEGCDEKDIKSLSVALNTVFNKAISHN